MSGAIRYAGRLAAQIVSTVVISAGVYVLLPRAINFAEDKMRKAENKKKRR